MKKLIGGVLLSLLLSCPAMAAVDLNKATQAELETVRGIGPSKAKAIVDYRAKNGPFVSVEALSKVKGFGKTSVEKLKPELTVTMPTK